MYLNLKIVTTELKTNFKPVLNRLGQYGLMLFFTFVSVIVFTLNVGSVSGFSLLILSLTYFMFMSSFVGLYTLYKLITKHSIIDADFYGVIAFGAIVYSVI